MRRWIWIAMWVYLPLSAACDVQITQVVPSTELETTERGAFTSDGRFWLIGTRAEGRADAGSWIAEVTKADASYAATNVVSGTLEGTSDGTIGGTPVGDPCLFSGMTVFGTRLYAGCVALDATRVSFFEVDTAARTVRTAYFTTCNQDPAKQPCENLVFYPNGMAADTAGRLYLSNMISHIALTFIPALTYRGSRTLTQVVIGPPGSDPARLNFTHRDWFSPNLAEDGIAPNGVQIENNVLYYAATTNINRIDLHPDGTPGAASVHYAGPALSVIDDFVVHDGRMLIARALPPGLVAIDRAPPFGTAPEIGTRDMPFDQVPSSLTYQADVPAGNSLFPAGSVVMTSFFGGGLYVLTGLEE
jgi:hypothetical protein